MSIYNELALLYPCFEQIKNTQSTIKKKVLLKKYTEVKWFQTVLKFLLDTAVTTGVDKKKLSKSVERDFDSDLHGIATNLPFLLGYIASHNTGRDKDISVIAHAMYYCGEYADFLADIITKSYRIGLTAKTANEVYGQDFIPVWQVQQAYPYEKYPLKSGEWFSISQKLNGFHASYYKGKLISRQGKEITGCQHIVDVIKKQDYLEDFFIDGELIRINHNNLPDEENFRLTASIANSDSEDKSELKFIYYDLIPNTSFENGEGHTNYSQRLEIMKSLNNILDDKASRYFQMVPVFYSGTNQIELPKWLQYADENDMEGCIVNRDTPYRCKRNKGVLKLKSWKHADLRVIGVEEGEGKYKSTLGKLIVDYKGNPLGLSGMSDEERDSFWAQPESIIGQIVLVKYKQETKDKNGKKSLQFATYQGVRTDKDEVSYN